MEASENLFRDISEASRGQFENRGSLLSYGDFISCVAESPRQLMRNAPAYLKDVFDHFGSYEIGDEGAKQTRWKLFDKGSARSGPIVGAEYVQNEIYRILNAFVKQGYANKLVVLHGPNGSAKTSMIESICDAVRDYSECDEGAVYRFNWIFPTDKSATPLSHGEAGPLGFGHRDRAVHQSNQTSYAHTEESKIASKITSEFNENPLFLLPVKHRTEWLRQVVAEKEGIPPENVELPQHMYLQGLSKRNQEIFEQLLAAYHGDIERVLRHVQVERFFYSRQYRVGISTVEPQMAIDAHEKQLTMDRNISNLPSVLHNISFHESFGPLIEANRGVLEFSDLLKRPLEAFKYLLSTVEKGSINLPTSTAYLDVVFFATTNEKHLDAFKAMPDFASFRSRFELVTAPYLVNPLEEEKIYARDAKILSSIKPVCPHSVYVLSLWAVLTRLKQPDPEAYDKKNRALIARLVPLAKAKLYEGVSLGGFFKSHEETVFKDLRQDILKESFGSIVFEGRFGASPREITSLLYKAVQNTEHQTLTPMCIFEELESIVKDRSTYEFLQLESKGKYNQPAAFIDTVRQWFIDIFEREVTAAMSLVEEAEYRNLLKRYVDNVVATVRKEKIKNPHTGSFESPTTEVMDEVENILKITGSVERHREGMLGKIAAYQIDHPNEKIHVADVFSEYLQIIQEFYYTRRKEVVATILKAMVQLHHKDTSGLTEEHITLAQQTYEQLQAKFGYDRQSSVDCVRFLIKSRGIS